MSHHRTNLAQIQQHPASLLISTTAATRLGQTRPTLICRSHREPVPSHLDCSLDGLFVKLVYNCDNRVNLQKMSLREVVEKLQYVSSYLPEDNEQINTSMPAAATIADEDDVRCNTGGRILPQSENRRDSSNNGSRRRRRRYRVLSGYSRDLFYVPPPRGRCPTLFQYVWDRRVLPRQSWMLTVRS